jgi:hypothetical protein
MRVSVRYRAKPSFTVEVKRNNKRVPPTVTPAGSFPTERHRQADQPLFGDLSSLAEPAERFKDSRLSTHQSDPEPKLLTAEAVTTKTKAEAGRVRPTGRILPDLLEESRAEMRLREGLEERAARPQAQRSARGPSSGSRSNRASGQKGAEADAGHKAVLDLTLAADAVSGEEPVLIATEVATSAAYEPTAASSLRPRYGSRQRTGTPQTNKSRRANEAVGHRSERQEGSVLLRAGERWKRRLPRVCW